MTFAAIPAGESVFLDANTLIYHFAADPLFGAPCTDLVRRIETGEIDGYTSTHVLSDVAHRLMTLEAMLAFGWPAAGIAQRLRRNRDEIAKLTRFRQAVEDTPWLGILVLPVTAAAPPAAAAASQQFKLLGGDALIVAIMQAEGITALASRDADFDGVHGLTRYAPL